MSNFCDQTTVTFIGGKGGDGAISFRKEKFIPKGGPDGGDGGNGGNIILIANTNITTLSEYSTKKRFKAEDGENGKKKKATGKAGENLYLKVPIGTIIINAETNEKIYDLKKHNEEFIIAKGGKRGLGNVNFKSSTHQAPKFAETGEEGQEIKIKLELKLMADIGIIGYPSAGKSTLISKVSNAKPKIADYPFTTLIPNLGIVNLAKFDKKIEGSFVIADIPGLIKGAHKGKGLGHKFLKHISRTKLLIHLIDPTRHNTKDLQEINEELENFNKKLAKKQQITVISKKDTLTDEELEEFIKKLQKENPKLKKEKIYTISSITGENIKQLMFATYELLIEINKSQQTNQKNSKYLNHT